MPSEYILDAKIHTKRSQYLYQFVKYVFPTQECVLSTHKLNNTRAKHSFYTDEYKKYVNALILRKLKLEGKLIKQVGEYIFTDIYPYLVENKSQPKMEMSKDSKYIALFIPKKHEDEIRSSENGISKLLYQPAEH